MNADFKSFIDIYLMEADERLQNLSEHLFSLEKEPTSMGDINGLLREAHTLKGNSRAMRNEEGTPELFSQILYTLGELFHNLETFMEKVRDRHLELTPDRIEILFEFEETFRFLIDCIKNEKECTETFSDLLEKLKLSYSSTPQTKTPSSNTLDVSFDLECFSDFHSIHFSLIRRKLKEKFEHISFSFHPSEDEIINGASFEKIIITFPSEYKDEIVSFLEKTKEVKDVSLVTQEQQKPEKKFEIPKTDDLQHKKEEKATLRILASRIDDVLKNVSSFIIINNNFQSIAKAISNQTLSDIAEKFNQAIDDLQKSVLQVRMVSLETVFARFKNDIRSTAKECGKKVNFSFSGQDTEIDKAFLEMLPFPLIHILRNSVVHGLETEEERVSYGKPPEGNLTLTAKQERNDVVISVEDDGKGIDVERVVKKSLEKGIVTEEKLKTMTEKEKINLIFSPGLSTTEKPDELSGRGVGMDVVHSIIVEKMKGSVEIATELGKGTKTILRIPLTLAIFQALITRIKDKTFAIPIPVIDNVYEIPVSNIKYISSGEVCVIRKTEIPIYRSYDLFDLGESPMEPTIKIVVVYAGDKKYAITVDDFLEVEDIVAKNIGRYSGDIKGISGCHILGNGEISLIIDVHSLAN